MKITVCANKGGVGKTTLAANLGDIRAGRGKRVLHIDADPFSFAQHMTSVNDAITITTNEQRITITVRL